MLNKKSNLVERRLYEYALHAVCSPFRVCEPGTTTDQLAEHVARLFNVHQDEHEEKYMRNVSTQPCPVILTVDVKKARNLLGEDQNGLSDPYCKVSVVHNPNILDDLNGTSATQTPPLSPSSPIRRTSSLFSCASASSKKNKIKSSSSLSKRRSIVDRLQTSTSEKNKPFTIITRRTEVQPKTINPEWNEQFTFEIENIIEQYLQITVLDSDRGEIPAVKTVVQQKRGISRKLQAVRILFATGQIDDDFLGQLNLDVKSLATFNREQWFSLTGSNQSRSNSNKSRGEIFLGLKVQFKLHEQINWLTEALFLNQPTTPKDDKKPKDQKLTTNENVLEFRRRHSALESNGQVRTSIISRSSIFRRNFRPSAIQPGDYANMNIFDGNIQTQLDRQDSCLMPATTSDSPLLIEEYHQLFRIIMLHQLENTRELRRDQSNGLVIDWTGSLSELSNNVLIQFRVLYNIPVLSESFIQLLVIMELRCSEDYSLFISQGVIEAYLKLFMDKVRQRSDTNDLDFTDYEKTVFKEIFHRFIDHYKQRVHIDAPWFLPSKEHLPKIQGIFDIICTLLQLKISCDESVIKTHLEQTIKTRLRMDISNAFEINANILDDKQENQLNKAKDFVEFIDKITKSMSIIHEYQKLFTVFNVNYLRICFFETKSAGDRLSETTKCLLKNMEECFQAYSRPMVRATSSIYDPNLIQNSKALLSLYSYIKTIVEAIRKHFEPQEWKTAHYKLQLLNYDTWYYPAMTFLIDGFVAFIRQVMERALEDDNDIIPEEDMVHYSESALGAKRSCLKLCKEWESIDYPHAGIRYTAMIKLTNTICEQCQHYAKRTARKLSENLYFTDLSRTRSFNVSKKLCTLVNDIEFVKREVLSSLPELLNFSDIINQMVASYQSNDIKKQTEITLQRLIDSAEKEMTDTINLIFEHVADLVQASLQIKISNYYNDEKRAKANYMDDVNEYIDKTLQNLNKGLEKVHYSRVACAIRLKVLHCLKELLPTQEPAAFYQRVVQSFDKLFKYFDEVCGIDRAIPSNEIKEFRRTLQTYAFTTEHLQLIYFKELCQTTSPYDQSTNIGEIVFRPGYEIVNDLITIYVHIVRCRHLPRMDYFLGASDPYVILELLPSSLYLRPQKETRTTVHRRTLDPEYNEIFQWHRLPTNVVHTSGAVLHLSVWDADYVKEDDFIGECFVPLDNIQLLRSMAALRDVPVWEIQLKKPQKSSQPRVFELIRNRIAFDQQAADFIKQRTRVMQTGKGSDAASVKSDDRNSAGSYASNALRSLACMLPFNIGFGSDTNGHDQSDVLGDDEII